MKLTHHLIHPALRGYVAKLWVYETERALPHSDLNVIVPNGLVKIVIPFRNGLRAQMLGKEKVSRAGEIALIGIADVPSVVNEQNQEASGSIGIEFSPYGAYRFFQLPLREIANGVVPLTEVLGGIATRLQQRLADVPDTAAKVELVQEFLLRQLAAGNDDDIFDYCVRRIVESGGRVSIAELEARTGYSSRWLNTKFHARIGISPKNLGSIVRFQAIYQQWAKSNFTSFEGVDIYSYFHDQSHFIRDFKRFTGAAPTRYRIQENDFGRIFYRG